jgi:hypothetical protein
VVARSVGMISPAYSATRDLDPLESTDRKDPWKAYILVFSVFSAVHKEVDLDISLILGQASWLTTPQSHRSCCTRTTAKQPGGETLCLLLNGIGNNIVFRFPGLLHGLSPSSRGHKSYCERKKVQGHCVVYIGATDRGREAP